MGSTPRPAGVITSTTLGRIPMKSLGNSGSPDRSIQPIPGVPGGVYNSCRENNCQIVKIMLDIRIHPC